MKSHLKYLSYVLRHKYHVARGGLIFGVSWWRILKHDWTKLLPSEWFPYVAHFYGRRDVKRPHGLRIDAFDRAWLRHLHRNDHHWQHWVLRNDDGSSRVLEMPGPAAREMVADWYGAGYAIHGRDDLAGWFSESSGQMLLNGSTRSFAEGLIRDHAAPAPPIPEGLDVGEKAPVGWVEARERGKKT